MKNKFLRLSAKYGFAALVLLGATTLNGQTLKHSYTFEDGTVTGTTVTDVAGTALGSPANGTINGSNWEVKNGYFYNHNSFQASGTTMGGYISFDGTAMALNTYAAVTIEAYITTSNDQNNPNKWSCLAYFGGASGANSFMLQPEISGSNTKAGLNNSKFAVGTEAGAKQTHHYVAVLTPSTATVDGSIALYYDGVLAQSTVLTANSYNTAVSALATTYAYLGKGAWSDALFTQPIHEFNIYDGAMDAATVASRYATMNSKLATLTVDAGTLKPAFDANIYNYGVVLPAGTTSLTVGATPASSVYTTVSGATTYDVSGADYGTITLKASTTGTPYLVNWRKDVATPVLTHSYTFADGTAKDVVGSADGTIMGAGAIANGVYTTTAGTNFASGTSQYISLPAAGLGITQYPSVTLEGIVKTSAANFLFYTGNQTLQNGTDYLYVHTTDFSSSCNINHQPWNGASTASGASMANGKAHHIVGVMTMDSVIVYQDGVYKTRTALSNVNQLFNISANVAYLGRSGYPGDANMIGSIGEFNIYKGRLSATTIASRAASYVKDATLSGITLSVGSLTFDPATTTYNVNVPAGTTSVTVGATVNKEFATVTGTGTITLSPGGIANLVVTSGDGSTTKTYTVNLIPPVPAISVAQTSLSFNSEIPVSQILTISGANLTDPISITAPVGITVNPTTLPANSTSASVSVTYDGVTAVSGNIVVASTGATSQNISVSGISFAGCDTKLYDDRTNLVTDPYLNSLTVYSASWGAGATINSDVTRVYCGLNSGKVAGTRAGSITYPLTGVWAANKTYRIRARVFVDAGTFNLNVSGWSGTAADIVNTITSGADWQTVDFTFTTGANITSANQFFYFNNYSSNAAGTGYIDNVEMYDITNIDATLSSLTLSAGALSPVFSPATTAYTANLPSGTTSVTPTAVANISGATVSGTEVVDVTSGSGTSTIEVKALDGLTTKTYTINYTVGTATAIDEVAENEVTILVNESRQIEIVSKGDGELSVVNTLGQKIYSSEITKDKTVINVIQAGIYIVTVNSNGALVTKKVTVK
ncbi:beta strand repeat-containing protein [Parabacteroides sp. FAFU027]|uniref:beta strand repeat-containing protein n=1 Tax=Parabacteroides sp. FAFU027 TaxID=2922715 RepID=UPI001FAF6804|nr:cadherin-like beta sandwich domain-containing protein [Parabacteroides sp. FAFU027]